MRRIQEIVDQAWPSGLEFLEGMLRSLDAGSMGMAVIESATGHYLHVNDALVEMLGHPRDHLLTLSWQEITSAAETDADLRGAASLSSQQNAVLRRTKRYIRGDGTAIWLDIVVIPVRVLDLTPLIYIMTMVDVSHESSLVALNRLLADVPEGDVVGHALGHGILRHAAPQALGLIAVDHASSLLHVAASFGATAEAMHHGSATHRLMSPPFGDVIEYGRDITSRIGALNNAEQRGVRWLAHDLNDDQVVVILPVLSRAMVLGVLLAVFPSSTALSWQLRTTLETSVVALVPWLRMWMGAHHIPIPRVRDGHVFHPSPRQMAVLTMLLQDMTNRQIARALGFAESTIKTDLVALSRGLNAHGRRDVIAKATAFGLLT